MQVQVIIEIVVAANITGAALISTIDERLPDVIVDENYQPIPIVPADIDMKRISDGERVITIRGMIEQERINDIEKVPGVLHIWRDAKVEPFTNSTND